jgi:hypothetical protein
MLYRVHIACAGFELTTLVVIGTDCIGSYKSNYHTIMTMSAPTFIVTWCVPVDVKMTKIFFYIAIDSINN